MKRLFQLAFAAAALACTTGRMTGDDEALAPAAESRDPERVFRKACEQLVALERTHALLKGVSEAKPVLERDEKERLRSISLVVERNALPPGKGSAKPKDGSRPFLYVSIQVWSGRTQQPPADLHEFEWKCQTYQMWVRVFGSDAELVKAICKSVGESLLAPPSPGPASEKPKDVQRKTAEELKEALVGRWVSDDADRVPVEFGADGSIRLAVCKSIGSSYPAGWKWETAEGTYVVSDGGRVEYTAKMGGLAIRGHYTMKDGVLIGPSGSNPPARWKKAPKRQNAPPAGEPLPPDLPQRGNWPGSGSSLPTLAAVTATGIAAVAKEKAEIQSGHAAHLSTRTTLGKGEVIEGGGYVFFARCRQKFQVLEILHGKEKPGDCVLEYGFMGKTEGFPLPGVEEPIPAGAKVILLLGEKGNILKALPDTQEDRKAVHAVLSEQKEKNVESDPPASAHKASDVELIANWLGGNDPGKAFAKPFGDRELLTVAKDLLLYTDIPGVKAPERMKAVNYEFVHARMQRIKTGQRVSPAVLIVRSSLDEPGQDEVRVKGKPGGRAYYVEVAIGNLAWHWMKVIVRDKGDKANGEILWHKAS